jgi:hypothetical protein
MADQDKTTKGRSKQGGTTDRNAGSDIASEHAGSISIADTGGTTGTGSRSTTGTGAAGSMSGGLSGAAGSTAGGTSSPAGTTGGTAPLRGTSTSSTGGGTGAATATARSLMDQAKETAGQAYEAVTDRAATTLDEKKSTVSTGLSAVADSLRQAAGNLSGPQADNQLATFAGKYTTTASQKLNDVARYFENTDVRGMVRDVEGYARRNPAIFIGAAFGLGILAARFLKSTPANTMGAGSGRSFDRGSNRLPGATDTASFQDDRDADLSTGTTPTPNRM